MIAALTALAASANPEGAVNGCPPPVLEAPDYVRFPSFSDGFIRWPGCLISLVRGRYLVVLDDGRFAEFSDLTLAYAWFSDEGSCWRERTAPRRALAAIKSWFSRLWFKYYTCRGL